MLEGTKSKCVDIEPDFFWAVQAALSCLWTQSSFDFGGGRGKRKRKSTQQQRTKQTNKNFLSLLPRSFPLARVGMMQGPQKMQRGQQKEAAHCTHPCGS